MRKVMTELFSRLGPAVVGVAVKLACVVILTFPRPSPISFPGEHLPAPGVK